MNIVWCIDDNYIKYAKVSIASYKKHNPKAKIYVVSEYHIENTIDYDENIIIKLPKKFKNRGEGDRITNTAYLKLFLTELPLDKILYVDADTICQKPLEDLWNQDIEYIGATETHSYGKQQSKELGIDRYALSGFLLLNLKNLRKINFTEESVKFEKENLIPTNIWRHEETILNCRWHDKIKLLPIKFHYCHNRKYDNPIPENEAYILHIVGGKKSDMYKYSQVDK